MQLAVIDITTGRTVRTVKETPAVLQASEIVINPEAQRYDAAQRRIFPLATPATPVRTLIAQLEARLKALEVAHQNRP